MHNINLTEYENVFSDDVINDLISSFTNVTRSTVGIDRVIDSSRTSSGTTYNGQYKAEIQRAVSKLLNMHIEEVEDIQLIQYNEGEEYVAHYDADENYPRKFSFLTYLNDDFSGGYTEFPAIKRKIEPIAGKSISWRNLRDPIVSTPPPLFEEYIDDSIAVLGDSLHAGLPVSSGTKLVMVTWLKVKTN